jgi:urease accessory protein
MDAAAHTIVLTQRHTPNLEQRVQVTLALTAEDRSKSRYRCQATTGEVLLLALPRGTVLSAGDLLTTDAQDWWCRIEAESEPVLIVQAERPLDLLRAAYHLGNRHVPLELSFQGLKLLADPVLKEMLIHQGLKVREGLESFSPEPGAYVH